MRLNKYISDTGLCSRREADDTARFVPARWKSAMVVRGELTGDRIPDVVLLVQGTDPARRIRNENLGESVLDTNPRRLIVLQGTPAGLRQIAASDRLVPPQGNAEASCLADPLEILPLQISADDDLAV